MFDPDALEYVIRTVQSAAAIQQQIADGYCYYFIMNDDKSVGYFAYRANHDKDDLFLSKLYLLPTQRGLGLGKKVITHIENTARGLELHKLSLGVFHRNKNAQRIYQKLGFTRVGSVHRDISNNMVLVDHTMKKPAQRI